MKECKSWKLSRRSVRCGEMPSSMSKTVTAIMNA